jgi:hypothetical protein
MYWPRKKKVKRKKEGKLLVLRYKNLEPSFKIVEFEWEEVKIPLTIAIWIFVSCIAKIRKLPVLKCD